MSAIGVILCPHLTGSSEGSVCGITKDLIKNMEGFTVKLCMSRRHEACSVYMQSLQNMMQCGTYSHCISAEPGQ
jgi:hypothetical protein